MNAFVLFFNTLALGELLEKFLRQRECSLTLPFEIKKWFFFFKYKLWPLKNKQNECVCFIFQCFRGIAGEISTTEGVFTDTSSWNKKMIFFFKYKLWPLKNKQNECVCFIFQCFSPRGIAGEISTTKGVVTDTSLLK